jgi:hypothetical protein
MPVGGPILEGHQAFFRLVGGAHIKALRGERGAQHTGDLRFVVNDQDSVGHIILLS